MVEPSALAETVMPPSASPPADLMAPDRIWSAACASIGTSAVVASARASRAPAAVRGLLSCMVSSPNRICFSCFRSLVASARLAAFGRRLRQLPEISHDGGDLVGIEVVLEARHPRRAVRDHVAHDVLTPAGRGHRQHRAELLRGDLRLGVADAARLIK